MTLNSIVMCTIVLFTIRENSIEFFLEFTVEFFSKGMYLRLASSLPLARNYEATTFGSQKDKPGIQETDFDFMEDSNKWN